MKEGKRRDGYKWDDKEQETQLNSSFTRTTKPPEAKPSEATLTQERGKRWKKMKDEEERAKKGGGKRQYKKGGMVRGCGKATKGVRKTRMY